MWLRHLSRQKRKSHREEAQGDTAEGLPGHEHCRLSCQVHILVNDEESIMHRDMGVSVIPKKTANDVLQQPDRLLIHKLRNHVAQNGADGVESFVCVAYVSQPQIVQENLLHDEYRDRFAEFGAGLHDTKTEWDNLSREKEVDYFRRVIFDKSTDYA